jgi:hypothetical protein
MKLKTTDDRIVNILLRFHASCFIYTIDVEIGQKMGHPRLKAINLISSQKLASWMFKQGKT